MPFKYLFFGGVFPHPCNSHDNWATNDYHEILKTHFSRRVKEQQIDAFCTPAWDPWGCAWDVSAAGVMVPTCLSAGEGLLPAWLSVGDWLWPSSAPARLCDQAGRQASTPEISQANAILKGVLCHSEKGWVKISLEGWPCPLGCSGDWWLGNEGEWCP